MRHDGRSGLAGEPSPGAMPGPSLRVAVALIAAAAIAYQLVLMRLLAVVHWQHFVAVIVSLALLGYGMSGTILSLAGERLVARIPVVFPLSAAMFGLAMPGCYLAAVAVPFNALELFWDPVQIAWLAALYGILAVPFLFAGLCIGLALQGYPAGISRTYAADLAGAGCGAAALAALLAWIPGHLLLPALSGAAWGSALLTLPRGPRRGAVALAAAAAVGAALVHGDGLLRPPLSPYKPLGRMLERAGAEIVREEHSALGRVSVVANDRAPLRHAPGLALTAPEEPPRQLAVFTNAAAMTVIERDAGPATRAYLDYVPSAAGYRLAPAHPEVLVLGAGGGAAVRQALHQDAARVDAVELNRAVIDLVRGPYAALSGDLYDDPRVDVIRGEVRSVLAAGRHLASGYDLIHVPPVESFAAASAGTSTVGAGYAYTVEALRAYLRRLGPDGVLVLESWLEVPPRGSLKLAATAIRALEAEGFAPAGRLAVLRSWGTAAIVLSRDRLSEGRVERLRGFARSRSYDLGHYPGMTRGEANRFNVWREPYLFDGIRALLSERRDRFLDAYEFHIAPATDDRPFFQRFFKWRLLPELAELRARGAGMLVDSGYLVQMTALVQAVLFALVLIVAPLAARPAFSSSPGARRRVAAYFTALGLAFLMLEIAFIDKLVLVLGHPVYAAAAALGAFLVFAGAGSVAAGRWLARAARPIAIGALAAVAGLALAGGWLLAWAAPWLAGEPVAARAVLSVALIAPTAFALGMPFPVGLSRLAGDAPALVPWAWAVNGCASVAGAVLASVVAMHLGFIGVVTAAAGLYLLAAGSLPGTR